ncbi:MAG: c-type cytochrome [Capsulimonas sp.]|uniref:c-type cytochrome n=1 Tax=Capsulimonas sp. TaxID=2494211 RepID=UPI003266EC5A
MKTIPLTTMFTITMMVVAVIAFITPSQARKGAAKPEAPPAAKSAAPDALVARGHEVFLANCAACHGADAGGDDGPNLHHKNLPDTAIAQDVANGFAGEMPAFGGKLNAPDRKAVVAYVRSLQK